MKKRWITVIPLLVVFMVAGCSKQITPDERLHDFVEFWQKGDYTQMYNEYLTNETTNTFSTENFIDRQEKLNTDLGIENLTVTYDKPETEKEWDLEEPAVFAIHITMDTIAGPLAFDKNLQLVHEMHGEEENWYAEWDPSFMLPGLGLKDTVGISTIKSERGEILDRNGKPIAINGAGYEIGIVPERWTDGTTKIELAELLGITTEYIDKQLNQSWVKPHYFVPIKVVSNTNKSLVDRVIELPGVTYQKSDMR